MNHHNAIRFALVASFVAVTGCAANSEDTESVETTAQAQTKEHILLARQVGFTAVARSMGTADGRIVVADAAGAEQSFVLDRVVYVAGAPVYESSRYELCTESRAGLTSCSDLAASPDVTRAHECDEDACWCEGALNCAGMLISGACDGGTVDCSDKACVCTF
jgi:hypothetical protein